MNIGKKSVFCLGMPVAAQLLLSFGFDLVFLPGLQSIVLGSALRGNPV